MTQQDFRLDRPAFWHYSELGRLRDEADIQWNAPGGFWMVQRHEHAREILGNSAVFTNETISPFHKVQELRLVPQVLDGTEHLRYRQLLNPWFSPGAVLRREPDARARCATLVEELVGRGACDFVRDFALRFPTEVFLQWLGIPTEEGERFLPWIDAIFAAIFGGDAGAAGRAIGAIYRYFGALAEDRALRPRDPATDFVSYLLDAEIDGQPLPRSEALTICLTLTLAGLDTTRAQLGYVFWHLARHPADRHRLIEEPALIPSAVEELLRLYGIIVTAGRRVAADIDFHGAPMAAGDVVWLGLLSANRDPRRFEEPDRYMPDRPANAHLAFGAGAHRCIGMHLARLELAVALQEWHRHIPDYELAVPDTDLIERGGQLTLRSLPLRWSPG